MRLLLDTHVYLWWLKGDRRLSSAYAAAIRDPTTDVLVSAASVWETAIKSALGKLEVDGDLVAEIAANRFSELPMTARHAQVAGSLPRHHDDPFDRMLVAQALVEQLHVATHDEAFRAYGVSLLAR